MKNCFNVMSLLILLTMASGCSKFRELTRRDYALLRDPFAARRADAESPPPVDAPQSTSGYVKLGDTDENPTDSVRADYSAVSQTKTVEAPSPTNFEGIRVRGMGDTVSTEIGEAARSVNNAATTVTNAARNAPGASEAAMADIANAARAKNAAAVNSGRPTPPDTGFADWASSKIERWKTEVSQTPDTAAPAVNGIRQVSKTDESSAQKVTEEASPYIVRSQERAQPLIKFRKVSPSARKQERLATQSLPSRPAVQPPPTGNTNPFADLHVEPASAPAEAPVVKRNSPIPDFDDFKTEAPVPPPGTSAAPDAPPAIDASSNPFAAFDQAAPEPAASKTQSLDDAFNWDTGWRPADAVMP